MRSDVLNTSSGKYGGAPETWKFSAKTADFTAAEGFAYLGTKLDGCDVTLPAPVVGARIKIVFGGVTSNAHTITADATTTLLSGYAILADTADGTAAAYEVFAPDETDDDAFSMNGGTTGVAGVVEVLAISNKMWQIQADLHSAGDASTPFA